jgi:subfamily B ATP-binding cassette protein MsbA
MKSSWADLREIILSHRKPLALGFLFMAINRLSGLVLPYSTRFLIDDVIGKGHHWWLDQPL